MKKILLLTLCSLFYGQYIISMQEKEKWKPVKITYVDPLKGKYHKHADPVSGKKIKLGQPVPQAFHQLITFGHPLEDFQKYEVVAIDNNGTLIYGVIESLNVPNIFGGTTQISTGIDSSSFIKPYLIGKFTGG